MIANFRCKECGEWFDNTEMKEKYRKDEPCLNCNTFDFQKCEGDFYSRECNTCEFSSCSFN